MAATRSTLPPAWVALFLEELARTGNVRVSATAAGVDYSTAYQRLQRDAGFRAAWAGVVTAREAGEAGEAGNCEPPLSPLACGESPSPLKGRGEELVVRCSSIGGAPKLVRAGPGRWSTAREARFIAALCECANVRRAAVAAGISTQALYARRLREAGFRAQWDAAIDVGKARLMGYLIEAADRTFDPASVSVGDDLPRVSVAEAIGIMRLKGGAAPASVATIDDDREAEAEEARERILARLDRLRAIDREEKLAAGWTECDEGWVPPHFRRIAGPEV